MAQLSILMTGLWRIISSRRAVLPANSQPVAAAPSPGFGDGVLKPGLLCIGLTTG